MNRRAFLAAIAASGGCASVHLGHSSGRSPWPDLLARLPPALQSVVDNPSHEVQLLYTRIDRDAAGRARLTKSPLHLAPHRWFSAASWVKLPVVLLTAERLTSAGATADARIVLDAPPATGNWDESEPLEEQFSRTFRRLFTVSENVPFNRLYEYLGQQEIGDGLARHGYSDARIIGRLGSSSPEANRHVGATRLVDASGRVLESRAARTNLNSPHFPYGQVLKGRGWQTAPGSIEPGPHDFSATNFLPLEAMHDMLAALLFPDSVPERARWRIDPALRNVILTELSRWPHESADPVYDAAAYPDAAAKFFVIGDSKAPAPDDLRMFGKSGQAYGYLQDCAYIVDRAANVECLLAATIHVNADGVFNDDRYEYDEIGLPFLASLGRAVLEFERERPRAYLPRLEDLPTSWS